MKGHDQMKVKRFITEYANSKIKQCNRLSAEYPHQKEYYDRMINAVNRAVWLVERGYITDDESIRLILESANPV
jgi:hypothetical protein